MTDFQIAGLRGAYRPVASSSLGQRSQVNPPTNQLNGGQRVANDTTTYNFGVSKIVPWGGGNFLVQFNNSRLSTNNLFANYNPNYTSTLTATYNQPLLRGFGIDADPAADRRHPGEPRDRRGVAARRPSRSPSPTSATPTGTWPTPAPPSTSRSDRSSSPRSWSRTTRPASRSARWPRSTSSRPRPRPPPGARPLAQVEATLATAQLSLKRLHRLRHQRPVVDGRSCAPSTCPSSTRRRSTSKAPSAGRSTGAPTSRRCARTSTATTSPCATGATSRGRRSTCRSTTAPRASAARSSSARAPASAAR